MAPSIIRAVVLLICLMATLTFGADGLIHSEYDKFEDQTTFTIGPLPVQTRKNKGRFDGTFRGVLPGKKARRDQVQVFFDMYSACPVGPFRALEQVPTATFLLNDHERVTASVAGYAGKLRGIEVSGVWLESWHEAFTIVISQDLLRSIANSSTVEIRAGSEDLIFEKPQLIILRQLAVQLKLVEPPPERLAPFKDTSAAQALSQRVEEATKAYRATQDAALARVRESPEYLRAARELDDADKVRQASRGQARLDAASKWLKLSQQVKTIEQSSDKDPAVVESARAVDAARSAFETARTSHESMQREIDDQRQKFNLGVADNTNADPTSQPTILRSLPSPANNGQPKRHEAPSSP